MTICVEDFRVGSTCGIFFSKNPTVDVALVKNHRKVGINYILSAFNNNSAQILESYYFYEEGEFKNINCKASLRNQFIVTFKNNHKAYDIVKGLNRCLYFGDMCRYYEKIGYKLLHQECFDLKRGSALDLHYKLLDIKEDTDALAKRCISPWYEEIV